MPGDEEGPEQRGWATYQPSPGPSPESSSDLAPTRGGGGVVGALVMVVVVLLVGVGVAVAALSGGGSETATEVAQPDLGGPRGAGTGPTVVVEEPAPTPDVLTRAGLEDLVAAIEDTTGGTEVFRAVLYPAYASVAVPEDASSMRQRTLFWNGELRDDDALGRSLSERVDLAAVDGTLLRRLVRRAEARVDDVTSHYVIVEGAAPTYGEDQARILAYASNDYSEGAYVIADLTGKVFRVVDY